MWYVSCEGWIHPDLPTYNIKIAFSGDGLNWEQPGKISLDFQENEVALARPCVLREDNIFKSQFNQRVAKINEASDARAKADAVRQEEEAYQNRERARRKREQENIEFARDLRKREDVRQTEAMQRRAERNIQKEVGGQMVERGARTTTSVIDRSVGGSRVIKKNLFIIDPAEGFDVIAEERNFTASHQILTRHGGPDSGAGKRAAQRLEDCGIITNMNIMSNMN